MNPYDSYKVNQLVNLYRQSPDMFNDDQLDELEQLAEQNNINFKRNTSPFSLRRAMQQASAGFIEGFTTLDLIPKEPRNTGEAIFRQLGHLAGFAPTIMKAPIIGMGKAIAKLTGRKSSEVLGGTITKSVLNGIDFMGDKSIPMIAQRKAIGLFDRGLRRSGADALEYMKRGSSVRAVAEEAVGLAGASAVSSVWKGPDVIIDSMIGGAIAGGAFGGIGQFVNIGRLYNGTPQQVQTANRALQTALGSLTTGLPATLRGEPTEMQIYEYLLGGFFGYQTRPAREREANKWMTSDKRYQTREGYAQALDPTRSKDFSKLSKEAQDYILYDHPMPKASKENANSENLGGTTGYSLGYLQNKFPNRNFRQEAVETLGANATEKQIRDWFGFQAGNVYGNIKINETAKPRSGQYKVDDVMDFNDPEEIQESSVVDISRTLYPTVNKIFKNEAHLARRIVKAKQDFFRPDAPQTEKFMSYMENTLQRKLNGKENSELRKWYNQRSMPINEVFILNVSGKDGKNVGLRKLKGDYKEARLGEKYYELPISRLTGSKFELLTHFEKNGKLNKVLGFKPDNKNKIVKSALSKESINGMHHALYNNGKYVFSGLKDKDVLLVAPLKTSVNGNAVTKEMLWDAMSTGIPEASPQQVVSTLREAYTSSSSKSNLPQKIHDDIYVSNVLHHATMHGLIPSTGELTGLNKLLQKRYLTSPADFNKRMQLLGNKMAKLDPESFSDIRPNGMLNVVNVKDADFLDVMTGKGKNNSMTDGGIYYTDTITNRVLSSLGLPKAGMFKPVHVGLGTGGAYATKSSGQSAPPALNNWMKANNIDAVVLDSSFKVGPDYARTQLFYNKADGTYSSPLINMNQMAIKDMQVSLGTYENVAKAIKGQEVAMQLWNQQDYLQAGFKKAWADQVLGKDGYIHGTPRAQEMMKEFENKKINLDTFKNRLETNDINIKELPVEFVINNIYTTKGNKDMGAFLLDKLHRLDKKGELEVQTFQAETKDQAMYEGFQERADRIMKANEGNFHTRHLINRNQNLNLLKKYVISAYANPFVSTGGKAWLKPVSPDMIPMITGKDGKPIKQIQEGHVYLDNAFKQMSVVVGNKQLTLGELWNIYTGAQPYPKGYTKQAVRDALELAVIRTPSDSPSGTRILRFGGFTNQNGAGAITHYKDDYYLGGADKDADSIKIFQGFNDKIKKIIKANKNEKENIREGSSKYNSKYDTLLNEKFKDPTFNDPKTLLELSGKGEKNPLDFIIPKASVFSPYYRMETAMRSTSGKDGLGFGLNSKIELQNIVDYIKPTVDKRGSFDVDTPYGIVSIKIKDKPVEGIERMQYFRDLGSKIVNKSADASNDPTIIPYAKFKDMMYDSILDVELINKKTGETKPLRDYQDFVNKMHSNNEMKALYRSIHITKNKNSFRKIDRDMIESAEKIGHFIEEKNAVYISPAFARRINMHLGERLEYNNELLQQTYFTKVSGPVPKTVEMATKNYKGIKSKIDPSIPKDYFILKKVLKPSKPEMMDVEKEARFVFSALNGKANRDKIYGSLAGRHMGKMFAEVTGKSNYEEYSRINTVFLNKYLGFTNVQKAPKEIKDILVNNTSVMLDDVYLLGSNGFLRKVISDSNYTMDQLGHSLGAISTINSLNKQFVGLENNLIKAKSKKSIKDLTKSMYKMTQELKDTKLTQADVNAKIKGHEDLIRESVPNNVDPNPFIKYYHTMAMGPFLKGTPYKGRYSNYIHGSNRIPEATRKEWYQNLEALTNKIQKDSKLRSDDQGKVNIEKDLKELPPIKEDNIIKKSKVAIPKPDNYDMLAVNDQDIKAVETFKENVSKHPIARENFEDFFTDFTSTYGDMVPKSSKDMTIKDVYALNQYFKRANDPSDFNFHVKYFLYDPKYIDELLKVKGIAKKVHEYTIKNPETGKLVTVAKIMSPYGEIAQYSKNVKDRGFDIDTTKLKRKHAEFFKSIEALKDKDNSIEQIIDFREGKLEGPLTPELSRINEQATKFFKDLGDNYIYTKDSKGERANWNSIDSNFNNWYKSTGGKLNKYMKWNKDGTFDFDYFYKRAVDYKVAKGNNEAIQKTVGIDGMKRFLYEKRLQNRFGNDYRRKVLGARQKVGYEGIGFIDLNTYVPHINFNKTEGARKAFLESVNDIAQTRYDDVLAMAQKKKMKNPEKVAEKAKQDYIKRMHGIGNMQSDYLTIQDIADLGEIDSSILNKQLRQLGFSTRIGPLEARTSNLQGYDKSSRIFNDYVDKVVNGFYKTTSAIHGNKKIEELKEWGLTRKIPQKEKDHFDNLYKTADRRKNRRESDPDKVQLVKNPRYRNYTDVWADYLKLHLQTVLGHQTYFPEQIIREVQRGIDPLGLKDKRNLFYLTSDQNMINMYEKLWQKKKFTSAPFIKHMFKNAPLDPKDRKEYFSRKIHDFGRMEAQYELMTLLANTGTYATNIVGGSQMIIGSAGLRNFINVFSKKKVYDRLLTSNGKEVIKLLDGTTVKDRAGITQYLKEQGIIDNFIQHEFEYNEGLKLNLKKAGVSLKNFQRDLTVAMKGKRPDRKESVLEVVNRYGVKDIMLKYGSFFMRHSEQVNRTNAYMAHAMQVMDRFGRQSKELSIADPFVHEMAMKGIENTQFLYQNSFRPMFMRTATGKVLTRFKLFAWNSIRVRRDFYKQAKMYGFRKGSIEYERAKDLFLTDMFMMALGGAFMFSIFDTALAPPYDWIQSMADWMYGDKRERDMAFFGSKLGPANLLKPPIARIPEAMGQILTGDMETFSDYTVYTLFPFGRMARQVNQLTDDRVGRGLERAPEILVRFPYNKIQSRIERAKRRGEQQELVEETLGV